MAANQYGTEAYEMSLFEPEKAKIVELKQNKKQIEAQKRRVKIEKTLNAIAAVLIAGIAIGIITFTLTSRAQLNEMNSEIQAKTQNLQQLEDDLRRQDAELAELTSEQKVQEYAEQAGMKKFDSNQTQYITVEDSGSVEVNVTEDKNVFEKIGAAISDFFAYLF